MARTIRWSSGTTAGWSSQSTYRSGADDPGTDRGRRAAGAGGDPGNGRGGRRVRRGGRVRERRGGGRGDPGVAAGRGVSGCADAGGGRVRGSGGGRGGADAADGVRDGVR